MGEVKGLPSNATFAALLGEIAEEEGELVSRKQPRYVLRSAYASIGVPPKRRPDK